jgi:hypothetical protein
MNRASNKDTLEKINLLCRSDEKRLENVVGAEAWMDATMLKMLTRFIML